MYVKRSGFELTEWNSKQFNWYHALVKSSLPRSSASWRVLPIWEPLTWDVHNRKSILTSSPRLAVLVSARLRP